MLFKRYMDKEDMIYVCVGMLCVCVYTQIHRHNEILLNHKKRKSYLLERCRAIILSKVSQAVKDKYCMISNTVCVI